MATAEYKPSTGLSVQVLTLHLHGADPGGDSAGVYNMLPLFISSVSKAWAIFKGKYKEGDMEGPAIWKTRLRCALNKSTEFEEVPENGHRDGAEPYKVYRLLPPGTLPGECPLAYHSRVSRLGRKDGDEHPRRVGELLPGSLVRVLPCPCPWDLLPSSPAQSCPSFHCLLSLPYPLSPLKALTILFPLNNIPQPQQGPRNHHQRDITALCPLRRSRMRVPLRTVYSAPPYSKTPSKT